MKIKYFGIIFSVFITSFLISYFLRNSNFIKELLNPKTELEFNNTVFDFGDIPHGKEATTYFVYSNTGKS